MVEKEFEQPKLTESSDFIKESASTGATNTKEEVPTTTSSVSDSDKPAALGESDKAATSTAVVVEEQVKTTESASSVATNVEIVDKIQEDAVIKPSENDEVTEPAAPPATQDEVKAVVTEAAVESSRTGSLATEKEKVSSDDDSFALSF